LRRWQASSTPGGAESRDEGATAELLLLWFLLPLATLLAASLIYPNIYIERSMIILLPPFFILLAVALMSIKQLWMRSVLAGSTIALSLLSLYLLWMVKADVWTVYKPNPDWRSAARYLVSDAAALSDPFFVVQSIPADALTYYYQRMARFARSSKRPIPRELPAGRMRNYDEAKFTRFLSEYRVRTIYLIRNTYWQDQFEEVYQPIQQSPLYQYLGQKEFKGLVIYKYNWGVGPR
jgi:hypothetical protein